jgi:hypothetical protein
MTLLLVVIGSWCVFVLAAMVGMILSDHPQVLRRFVGSLPAWLRRLAG